MMQIEIEGFRRILDRLDRLEKAISKEQDTERHVPTQEEMIKEVNNSAYNSVNLLAQSLIVKVDALNEKMERLMDSMGLD